MPLKEYRCVECRERFDAVVWRNEFPSCPHCGSSGGTGGHNRVWTSAPKVIMRPEGYDLRPGEPGYSKLTGKVEKYKWQSS